MKRRRVRRNRIPCSRERNNRWVLLQENTTHLNPKLEQTKSWTTIKKSSCSIRIQAVVQFQLLLIQELMSFNKALTTLISSSFNNQQVIEVKIMETKTLRGKKFSVLKEINFILMMKQKLGEVWSPHLSEAIFQKNLNSLDRVLTPYQAEKEEELKIEPLILTE